MEEDYSKYTDENLLELIDFSYDLDESIFFILTELGDRKNPKTKDFCLRILKENLKFDEFFVNSALTTFYYYDENSAIQYMINNLTDFHIYNIGGILSLLWPDSNIVYENNEKVELVKLIKEYLKSLSKKEIADIQNDYDEFINAYNLI
jgi:hypothetical protein